LLLTGTIASAGNAGRSGFKPPGPPINNAATMEAGIPEINAGILVVESEVVPRFNAAREEYGAPLFVPPMNPDLVAKAQRCANELTKRHPNPDNADVDVPSNREVLCDEDSLALQYFEFGEAGETVERYVAKSAVEKWLSEQKVLESPSLLERRAYNKETRHFTQIIWKDTTSLGCAVSAQPESRSNRKIFVCFFDPAGNVQYGENNVAFRANIGESEARKLGHSLANVAESVQ
jgi:hypothetical protein